jgi:hypothetical protein
MGSQYRDILVFTTLYLFLSLPPFLLFNRAVLSDIRTRLAFDIVAVAVAGTVALVVLTALVLASEGVSRYNQFLAAPTDLLSVLVALSFLLAATAWWTVPELLFRVDISLAFDLLIILVLFCQLPMIIFLSLLTAIGKA